MTDPDMVLRRLGLPPEKVNAACREVTAAMRRNGVTNLLAMATVMAAVLGVECRVAGDDTRAKVRDLLLDLFEATGRVYPAASTINLVAAAPYDLGKKGNA